MVATVLKNLDSILRASNASADAIKQITDHCGQVLEHAIMRADTDLEAVFAGEKTLSEFIVENNGSIDNLGSSALKALNTIVATKVQHQVFRNAAATFIKNPPPGVTPDEFLKTYPDIASDKN